MRHAHAALAILALAAAVPAAGEATRLAVVVDGEHGPFTGTPAAAPRPAGIVELPGGAGPHLFLEQGALLPLEGFNPDGAPLFGEALVWTPPATERDAYLDERLLLGLPLGERPLRLVSLCVAAGRVDAFESSDHITVEFQPSAGGPAITLARFAGMGASGSAMALDTDGDGTGDGDPLRPVFRNYRFVLPEGTGAGSVRVRVDVDGNEEVAIDAIEVRELLFGRERLLARVGFEGAASEHPFTTNINPGAVTSTDVTFAGATFAGDGFNDYFALYPPHAALLSETNVELGFLPADGDNFLVAEDTGADGMPGQVVVELAPIDFDAIPFHFAEAATVASEQRHGAPAWLPAGGADLESTTQDGYTFTYPAPVDEPAQTWMAWVKPETILAPGGFNTEHPHAIITTLQGTALRGFLRLAEGRVQFGWHNGSTFPLVQSTATLSVGEWVHLCGRSNGAGTPSLFINGVPVPTTTAGGGDFSSRSPMDTLRIGLQGLSGNIRAFDGELRDVRVVARELSDAEIAAAAASPVETDPSDIQGPLRLAALSTGAAGAIRGWFLSGADILQATFDPATRAFSRVATARPGDALSSVSALAVEQLPAAGLRLHYTLGQGASGGYLPAGAAPQEPGYYPYDGAGIWLGEPVRDSVWTWSFGALGLAVPQGPPEPAQQGPGLLLGASGAVFVQPAGGAPGLLASNALGHLSFFPSDGDSLLGPRPIVDAQGRVLRAPEGAPSLAAIALPSGDGVLLGGDGALHAAALSVDGQGRVVVDVQGRALQRGALLSFGADPVLTGGDLDGDGLMDLLAGNAEGALLWARNVGTAAAPAFLAPEPVLVGGRPFDKSAGYQRSLLGPRDARRGWASPTLFDWDGDGAQDILLSGVDSEHYFLRRDTPAPGVQFDAPLPLYADGLELHTTWRVQPAVTDGAGAWPPSLIAFDVDDALARFEQLDAQNVRTGVPLLFQDNSPIKATALASAATGRTRLQSFDWDGDGLLDVVAGVRSEGPAGGLSGVATRGEAVVLLLRNVGTNAAPRLAAPLVLSDEGVAISFGAGECSPLAFMAQGSPRLLVGESSGHVVLVAPPLDPSLFDGWMLR